MSYIERAVVTGDRGLVEGRFLKPDLNTIKNPMYARRGHIAHLAETRFGFSTSTLLPTTPQTPKHLGFGVIMPFSTFRVRRDTPFGIWSENACVMAKWMFRL
jgi:hypothetical protein